MRDYGRIHGTFWSSPTTAGMTDKGKLLALYLMSCTHGTIAGVFRLPDGYIAEDLQWEIEDVRQAFGELLTKGFANRCETTKWVWLVKHLEWNPPENPNQRKAAFKVASGVPIECSWHTTFVQACGESLGLSVTSLLPTQPLVNPSTTVPVTVAESVSVSVSETVTASVVDAADAASSTKGSRLPRDWVLPRAWGDWALQEFPSWTVDTVRTEAAKFGDYWTSKTGKDATKLDWQATWRNWCRNARPVAQRGGQKTMNDEQRAAANEASTAEAARLLGFLAANNSVEVINATE